MRRPCTAGRGPGTAGNPREEAEEAKAPIFWSGGPARPFRYAFGTAAAAARRGCGRRRSLRALASRQREGAAQGPVRGAQEALPSKLNPGRLKKHRFFDLVLIDFSLDDRLLFDFIAKETTQCVWYSVFLASTFLVPRGDAILVPLTALRISLLLTHRLYLSPYYCLPLLKRPRLPTLISS